MKKVLIITHSKDFDYALNPVKETITKQGAEALIFYTDLYPIDNRLAFIYLEGQKKYRIFANNAWHDIEDISGIWYRRIRSVAAKIHEIFEEDFAAAAQEEAKSALYSFLAALEHRKDLRLANKISNNIYYSSKEYQTEIALSLGWKVPESLIANSHQDLLQLVSKYPNGIIAKSHSGYYMQHEEWGETSLYSTLVTADDIEDLGNSDDNPMIFQEYIGKNLELRIPVMGDKAWAFSIDSQVDEEGAIDWRKNGFNTINRWKPFPISDSFRQQLVEFNRQMGCYYSSFDFILSPKEELVFLETNTGGEFFWLDEQSQGEISATLVAYLLGK